MSKTKKLVVIVCAVLGVFLVLGLIFGTNNSTPSENIPSTENSNPKATISEKDKDVIDNCKIVFKSCEITEDYEGNPVALVKVDFTNLNDDSRSFDTSFIFTAFQNGIECEHAYTLKDSVDMDDFSNLNKSIKKDCTIEVSMAFKLNDTVSPIEVEINPWLTLSDEDMVSQTFDLK